MSKVDYVESEIRKMNPRELAEFRSWFLEFDAREWDEEIEADARSGRLEKFAEKARKSIDKATEI